MTFHRTLFRGMGAIVTLVLALGLSGGPVRAATTVDVTYDLSDTTLNWESKFGAIFPVSNDFAVNGVVAGSMKVQYVSDSSSGMPIEHGTAKLLTFNLTAKSLSVNTFVGTLGNTVQGYYGPYLTGTLHWQLTAPVTGNLNSNGVLTGLAGRMHMTGTAKCPIGGFAGYYLCSFYWGLPYSQTIHPNRYRTGAINVGGSVGAAGGALSTRHTLTGTASAVTFAPAGAFYALGSPDFVTQDDRGGVFVVGREILREADGHDPKVIPEPGTLLLLGAGAAGLGALGRVNRRSGRG